MDLEVFKELVLDLQDAGVEEIGLFYIGEPMLADNLVEAIRFCKTAGIKYVFLTTNGQLATPERVKQCMEAGLNSLKFSFNYSDGQQIRQVAGVSPRIFDKIVQNIKSARMIRDDYGFNCGIYASSIMFDGKQGEAMKKAVELIIDHVDEHYWLPCFTFGGQVEFGKQVRGNPGRLDEMRDALPCWAVFREGHITANGDVSACCFDTHERWVMGNINEEKFSDIWNNRKFQQLRQAHLNKDVSGTPCEHCAVG
jgi:radical SAM protein with 4Fe4S-binding SPASM domain